MVNSVDYMINEVNNSVQFTCSKEEAEKHPGFLDSWRGSFPNGLEIIDNFDGTISIIPSKTAHYGQPYTAEALTNYVSSLFKDFNLNKKDNLEVNQTETRPDERVVDSASSWFGGLFEMASAATKTVGDAVATAVAEAASYLPDLKKQTEQVQNAMAEVANHVILETLQAVGLVNNDQQDKVLAVLLLLATKASKQEIAAIIKDMPEHVKKPLQELLAKPDFNQHAALTEVVRILTDNEMLSPTVALSLCFIAALPSMMDKEKLIAIVQEKFTEDGKLSKEGEAILATITKVYDQQAPINSDANTMSELLHKAANLLPATATALRNMGWEEQLQTVGAAAHSALPTPSALLFRGVASTVAPGSPQQAYYLLRAAAYVMQQYHPGLVDKISSSVKEMLGIGGNTGPENNGNKKLTS